MESVGSLSKGFTAFEREATGGDSYNRYFWFIKVGVSPYVAYMYMPLRSLHAYSVRVAECTVTLFGQETHQFMGGTLSQLGPFSRRTATEDLLNSVNTFTLYCDLNLTRFNRSP